MVCKKSLGVRLPKKTGSVLVHGGGWKKIEDQKVSKDEFDTTVKEVLGFDAVINYYGMVEQVGSIFFECPEGYLHAPGFSEIITRCPKTFSVLPFGEQGLIQVVSVLPKSYPGNSILTEDVGILHGRDSCKCGVNGAFLRSLVVNHKPNQEGAATLYNESSLE